MLISVANHLILKNNTFSIFFLRLRLHSFSLDTILLHCICLRLSFPWSWKTRFEVRQGQDWYNRQNFTLYGIFNTQVNRSHMSPTEHTGSKLNATRQKWLEIFPCLSVFFWRLVKNRLKGFIIKQFRKEVTLWCNPGQWWCFWLILSQIRLYREGCLRATASSHSVIFDLKMNRTF